MTVLILPMIFYVVQPAQAGVPDDLLSTARVQAELGRGLTWLKARHKANRIHRFGSSTHPLWSRAEVKAEIESESATAPAVDQPKPTRRRPLLKATPEAIARAREVDRKAA